MKETWWISSAHRDALRNVTHLSIPAWMHSAQVGTYLSSDRRSVSHALDGEPALLVKWRIPRATQTLKNRWRPSRARREARLACALRARDIQTPEPVAAAERRRGRALLASLFLRVYRPDWMPVTQALATERVNAHTLMAALRTWHTLGFRHGDAYPKNMLWDDERKIVVPIGFPAGRLMDTQTAPLDRAAAKDVAQLLVGLWLVGVDVVSAEHLPAMASLVEKTRNAQEDAALLWHVCEPRVQSILRKKRVRRETRPEREPDGPTRPEPLPLDEGVALEFRELI